MIIDCQWNLTKYDKNEEAVSFCQKDGDGTCELNDHEFSFIEENVNFVHQEDVTFSMKVIQLLVCVTVKANVDQYCLTF